MKRIALILLATVVIFSACKKEDTTNSPDNSNPDTNSYSSTITINENTGSSITLKGGASNDRGEYSIYSVTSLTDTISKTIHFTAYEITIGTHTYNENSTYNPFNMQYTNANGTYQIIQGDLTFSTIDTVGLNIKGNYNVTAAKITDYNSQINISGVFDIEYLIAN
jgi:hypothetical protein